VGTTAFGTGSTGATSDRLNNPSNLVINSSNFFYISDTGNHRIQKLTATSLIGTTVVGQANGNGGSGNTFLNSPTYVLIDSSGNLYVSDNGNARIQYFASGSMTGTTLTGTVGKFLSISVLH
jgi:hypothetical protein